MNLDDVKSIGPTLSPSPTRAIHLKTYGIGGIDRWTA